MKQDPLTAQAIDILLKEYDTLRLEISERLKIAFSHVAYGGAIFAFAVPASKELPDWAPWYLPLAMALIGVLALGWVAWLNMRWVQHCGRYIETIEQRINAHFGQAILGWDGYASNVQSKLFLGIPKKPSRITVADLAKMMGHQRPGQEGENRPSGPPPPSANQPD